MPTLRRANKAVPLVAPDDVIWGIPRREAASDQDDPLVHAGVTQHAFLIGVDYEAICGFKPPLRSGFVTGTKSPQLALPGRDNPRCPKCSALVSSVGSLEEEAEAALILTSTDESDLTVSESDDALTADVAIDGDAPKNALDADDVFEDEATDDETVEVLEDEADDAEGEDEASVNARDSAWAPRRSSARRGGVATVPQGKRSVVVQLPDKLIGSVIAADIDGERGELRVRSVVSDDDGTIRITLNQPAPTPVEVLWFVVSGSQRS
jgi:hypothetical protein